MSEAGTCSLCYGTGKNMFNEVCTYCNGTGEHNVLADQYLDNHICQCITWDREHCPVCKKKCHHDSKLTPKQRIVPGYGGMTAAKSITSSSTAEPETKQEEEMISA